MFKKTLVAAALATATMGASAAVQLAGDAFQIYGQAAGFAHQINPDGDDGSLSFVMESRVGFKGVVEFESFAPNFIWQIEGGNADNQGFVNSWETTNNGQLGARDTYIGLDFEGVGSVKFGRQLVAAYNLVDWPHSNPGLGNVFDWNNDLKVDYESRADNTLRYDSANWGGVTLSATLSNMAKDLDQMVYSAAVSYSPIDSLNLHAGYYGQSDYTESQKGNSGISEPIKFVGDGKGGVKINPAWTLWDKAQGVATDVEVKGATYAIVGATFSIDALTLTGAYKAMEQGDNDQDAVSATAQYVIGGQYVLKAGYAATFESKNGTDDNDTAITGRLGYMLPSTYLYFDVRDYSYNDNKTGGTNFLLGGEYYF